MMLPLMGHGKSYKPYGVRVNYKRKKEVMI